MAHTGEEGPVNLKLAAFWLLVSITTGFGGVADNADADEGRQIPLRCNFACEEW